MRAFLEASRKSCRFSDPIHEAWAYLAPRDSTKPHVYMDEGQWWCWRKEDSHVHGPYPSVQAVSLAHPR